MGVDPVEDDRGQVVPFQQPAELQQGRGIRAVVAAQVDLDKTPDHLAVVDRILDPFTRQVEALPGHVHPQHPFQTNRRTTPLPLRAVRLDRLHQRRPGRDRIDLPESGRAASACAWRSTRDRKSCFETSAITSGRKPGAIIQNPPGGRGHGGLNQYFPNTPTAPPLTHSSGHPRPRPMPTPCPPLLTTDCEKLLAHHHVWPKR